MDRREFLLKSNSLPIILATFFLGVLFISKTYVGEFLHYHPITGFINHPTVLLPWSYFPKPMDFHLTFIMTFHLKNKFLQKVPLC